MLEKVLIALKNCKNEEILNRGNQDKFIKLIWQKNEESVLFDESFLNQEKIFEDLGVYKQIEDFIIKALEIDIKQFYSQRIDFINILGEQHESTKAKISYLYLRSNENLPQIQDHIFQQIQKLDFTHIEKNITLIAFRAVLNLLINSFYWKNKDLQFRHIVDLLVSFIKNEFVQQTDYSLLHL